MKRGGATKNHANLPPAKLASHTAPHLRRAPVDVRITPKLTMALSEAEIKILGAFRGKERHLTFGVLKGRTGISAEVLSSLLEGLRSKGLLTRLNTVVEAYACRFPGLKVDDA